MTFRPKIVTVALVLGAIFSCSLVVAPPAFALIDSLVTTGSPVSPYPRNGQWEPSVAIDPINPLVQVAGAIDDIDSAPCSGSNCNFHQLVGRSGVYFSFNGGTTWSQPTYTGISARTGAAIPGGPIGTVPNHYEAGFRTRADPVLAFGPSKGIDGTFSYLNGTTLYYASYTQNISGLGGAGTNNYPAVDGISVSRTSDLVSAAAGNKTAWSAPVMVNGSNEQSSAASDKEWIWVDNAESSPYFGNVYVCFTRALPPYSNPMPIVCSRSSDGGVTFSSPIMVSGFPVGAQFRVGAQVRTDNGGVVYVSYLEVQNNQYKQVITRSYDGGLTYDTPRQVSTVTNVGMADPLQSSSPYLNRSIDGRAGTRIMPMPSMDIANGAPTGLDATNTIAIGWSDGRAGANNEDSLVSLSTDGGATFGAPQVVSDTNDRSGYTAVALSPNGQDLYLTYNAFTTPFQTNTTAVRPFLGVVRHARVQAGTLSNITTLHRGQAGDARASARNTFANEFVGDYIGLAATNFGATATYADGRRAVICPAVITYRQRILNGQSAPAPSPTTICPAGFGNTDIFAAPVLKPLL